MQTKCFAWLDMTALYEVHSLMEKFLWKEVFKFLQKNFMLISNKECASL